MMHNLQLYLISRKDQSLLLFRKVDYCNNIYMLMLVSKRLKLLAISYLTFGHCDKYFYDKVLLLHIQKRIYNLKSIYRI